MPRNPLYQTVVNGGMFALLSILSVPVLAQTTNVVPNPNFALGNVAVGNSVTLTTQANGSSELASAAADWSQFNQYAGTTTTTLVSSSSFPGPEPFSGGSANLLHVVTDRSANGIIIGYPTQNLPNTNNASTWIYVVSGEASFYSVQDGGFGGVSYNPIPTGGYAIDNTVGQWVYLNPTVTEGSTSHYIEFEAGDAYGNGGSADFYVGLVQANASVPESNTMMILLLGGAVGVFGLWSQRSYCAERSHNAK